jgi:biotin transport system substrate-specific component
MASFVTTPSPTLAHHALPRRGIFANAWISSILLIVAGTLFVALSAQIRILLPFTPVPITGQTFGVVLVGSLLGSRKGVLSLLLYLIIGAIGVPVFTGAEAGWQYMQGATFGYLLGFPLAAALTGWLAERGWDRRMHTTILSMVLGNLVIYILGVAWFATLVGLQVAVMKGMVPFLIGDVLKIALAAIALPGGWKLLGHTKE